MNPLLQAIILATYRTILRTGVLNTRVGYQAFERCYDVYKRLLEAPFVHHVRPFVEPGSVVFDVGAHVGFFSERFADWVGETGRVIALEPEPINYGRLCRRVQRRGFARRVATHQAAAVEKSGDFHLLVNIDHPGDHQLAESGLPVPGLRLDDLLPEAGAPVSLVKLDIQGAETRALEGAQRLLETFHPVLMVELDPARLKLQGSSPEALLEFLAARGYAAQQLTRNGLSRVLLRPELLALADDRADGYADLLFVPQA